METTILENQQIVEETKQDKIVEETNPQEKEYQSQQLEIQQQPQQLSLKKKNTSVDYKYICIKKDQFDISMVYLNYLSLQQKKFIEIIYKSPSVFLDGLFFKTPLISL